MITTQSLSSMLEILLGMDRTFAVVLAISILSSAAKLVEFTSRNRERNRVRNRQYGLDEMDALSDAHFKRMFRMKRETFNLLEQMLQPFFDDVDEAQGVAGSGSCISTRTRLACTLRWLAGGIYLDICFAFGVGFSTFYHERGVLWPTMEALNELFHIGFPFDDDAELSRLSRGFQHYGKGRMPGCVMAIDGWVCRTRQPTAKEVDQPRSYFNRHECYGIVVMAGCDADCKFNMFSCLSAGSTNDVVAWDISAMKRELDAGSLPLEYFFIGDEAFVNSNQLMVPWSGHGLDPWRDSFNFHLSSMRQCIERAFVIGITILHHKLQSTLDVSSCRVSAKFCSGGAVFSEEEETPLSGVRARLRCSLLAIAAGVCDNTRGAEAAAGNLAVSLCAASGSALPI
eukprot:CAMPEP_0175017390 /NCGR_PEP_ID=MMETSP0005-20121125/12371_1 /TAXON_ID=420556 /ORGANISM="Ochromonas sp., Strain CCMP1393" /LENGTH=398 /DNA_ID=CAMNT_0016274799 /DNA_START=829 /DNA_END=2026 /DNA_ORIENTATION=+